MIANKNRESIRKEGMVRARVNKDLKDKAESIFHELGISATEAITLFYRQVELNQGLPFQVLLPNEETKKAIAEAKSRKGLKKFDNLEDAFDYLGI